MKRVLIILLNLLTITAMAQTKGRFEVHDLGNFKLHVYHTNDVMADASYIIEGKDSLVTMEHPLFKDNVAEFNIYIEKLGKPIEKIISDYHLGGSGNYAQIMAEGMEEFSKGPIYGGMMKGFEQMWGDTMTELPTGDVTEVPFGTTQTWAGVTFEFRHGASSDFPAASLLIGGKVYYTHWTPAMAHVSHLQISSPVAIDAEIAEAEKSLASGAELFIGGHGGAAKRDAVEFKIAYLKKMKEVFQANENAEAFVAAMEQAYPELPGAAGLADLGKALYR
nr:hypothetical protein [uncultured Alistipes sp.]